MSATIHEHDEVSPAQSADDRAANCDAVPARVGIRSQWLRYWPAAAGGLFVLAAMLGLLFNQRRSDSRSILNGRSFTAVERRAAEALREAGNETSSSGHGQSLVRPEELQASHVALPVSQDGRGDGSKTSSGSWLDVFSSSRRQQAVADTASAARLGRLLADLPGVDEAEVIWDEEPRVGRRQAPRARATVFLKPAAGCVIGLDTVQAVRAAVSGSRAYLAAQDVAVMDLERRVTYGAPSDPVMFAAEVRRAELIAACRTRLEAELADIPGVGVALDLVEASEVEALTTDGLTIAEVMPTTRTRITGVSGPNLRLEVPGGPPPELDAVGGTHVRATASAQRPQLNVHVVLPDETAAPPDSRRPSRRRVMTDSEMAGLRQRIVAAVSGLPVMLPLDRLRITAPRVEVVPPMPLATQSPSLAGAWEIAGRLASMPLVQRAFAGGMIAALLWIVVRRVGVGKRRSTRSKNGVERPSAGRPLTAIEFLPGVEAAAWTPLLAREPVDIIAGVLRQLSAADVAKVLSELAPDRQSEVLELAPTAELSAAEIDAVRRRLRVALRAEQPGAAPRPAMAPPVVRRPATKPDGVSVFDDLIELDDDSLRALACEVHSATWSAAQMGAAPKLQRRMSRVTGSQAGVPDVGERRPVRLREIESAQRAILDAWQALPAGG